MKRKWWHLFRCVSRRRHSQREHYCWCCCYVTYNIRASKQFVFVWHRSHDTKKPHWRFCVSNILYCAFPFIDNKKERKSIREKWRMNRNAWRVSKIKDSSYLLLIIICAFWLAKWFGRMTYLLRETSLNYLFTSNILQSQIFMILYTEIKLTNVIWTNFLRSHLFNIYHHFRCNLEFSIWIPQLIPNCTILAILRLRFGLTFAISLSRKSGSAFLGKYAESHESQR